MLYLSVGVNVVIVSACIIGKTLKNNKKAIDNNINSAKVIFLLAAFKFSPHSKIGGSILAIKLFKASLLRTTIR